jgi:hypothetical protein
VTSGLVPPAALQLLGFVPVVGQARPKGHINTFTDVTQLINRKKDYSLIVESIASWELNSMLNELVESSVSSVLEQRASLISFFLQSEDQERDKRQKMRKPIEAMLNRIMNHVQRAFWGADPYPDERNLESFMFVCLTANPKKHATLRELFRTYQSSNLQFILGTNPYRLDALRIEHAAELKDIAEVVECQKVYDTFSDKDKKGLHVKAEYA